MYQSKYYTCEEIDERLLKGYYNDAVSKGYSDTFEQFKTELASINGIATKVDKTYVDTQLAESVEEVIKRLQGTSANQDGYKDPIFTKEFANGEEISALNTWLDNQFFAIKDGVYYRNGQSGTLTISKDVPQCLININFQGVKMYVFNAPKSFSSGEFEQIAFGVRPISEGGGITWGSDICRRKSTYDFNSKQVTWSAWESITSITSDVNKAYVDGQLATKADKTYVDTQLATKANKTYVDDLGKEISTNSSSIDSLGEAMEGVLYDIGQIKDNIEIAGSTVIELEASTLGITSDTTLTEGALIDVASGVHDGGILSTEIALNTGQTITSSANNIRALTVFAGNVMGRIKHRVLQVGEINYTANEPMSVYVCYRPQGAISTEVKVKDRTQLEELVAQKADKTYVDTQLDTKADKTEVEEQRISYVSPCFADCAETHEAKLKSITLASSVVPFKTIFSVTLKIANGLTLRNQSPTYMHLVDLLGNTIGVSQNAVSQVQNKGKYVTWFFDSAINTTGASFVIKLHTTNSASSASDSNLVQIIAHVNQNEGMKDCGVTDGNGTYHTDWTPALGINVVNLAAIYPQIKELQKYRMAYATSELPDISTTGHKANIKEIRINQNVMGISLVNSVSIMVASDNAYSGALELRVYDINDNLIATSNNTVNLSQNLGKYVTWYFTPFQLNLDAVYRFSVWSSGTSQVMRIHLASGKSEGVTCYDQNNSPHTDYCPAFGINISAIFADDLRKSIKEVNLALGNAIVTKAEISYVDNKVSPKADKTYVDTQLATKVDKVAGKGLSSNDFTDRYKFAIQPLAEILEKKNETQNGVTDIVSNFCLGTLWEEESLLNVNAIIPIANHYTFRHKIDGSDNKYVELSCNTYYVDNYNGSTNLKELFIRVPYDEHTYILLRCEIYNDGHNYVWIVKEKSSIGDDVHDTAKIPYLFSPLRYTDDKVKELQSKITALETRIISAFGGKV